MNPNDFSTLPLATDAQINEAYLAAEQYLQGNAHYSSTRHTAKLAIAEYHLFTHYGTRLARA